MAHTKSGGSTALGRDSQSKRLGIKLYAGETTRPGMILIRQRGAYYLPGINVKRGSDDTLFATAAGKVSFHKRTKVAYDGRRVVRSYISVK